MGFLTNEEKVQLKTQHKRERDGRIRDRIKAVLLYDEGWSSEQIAKVLLISDQAVLDHIKDYQAFQKLKPESGGSEEKFSKTQSEKLEAYLQVHTFFSVKDIVAYVQVTFGIAYTIPGMRSWLHRHGFSYKKPSLIPGKADKKKQEAWLSEYDKLRQELSEDETICFIDGVHPTHNVQSAFGWIKKGIRKEIATNTGRSRVNISGAINVITHDILIQEDQTLNAESTIRFFQKIEARHQCKRKIHLFCDNAAYYRNRSVREYLKTSKIKLHFLPPYSPNLNPVERLWKWMKERVLYNTYYEHFEDFKVAIFGFFTVLSSATADSILGQTLRRRVRDKFRPIQAPRTNF